MVKVESVRRAFIKPTRSTVYFSDDGVALAELKSSGVSLNTNQRLSIKQTIERLGTELRGDELVADCPRIRLKNAAIHPVDSKYRSHVFEQQTRGGKVMIVFAIIATSLVIFALLLLLGSCKVAGDFDEAMDAWYEQKEGNRNGN